MLHGDLLGERARLTPEREALVMADGTLRLTYGELDARALATATVLRDGHSVAKGDRVGLLAGNCPEFLDVFFAAGKSGMIVVPLSTRATVHELDGIVRDSGMRLLVHGPEFADTAERLLDSGAVAAIAALGELRHAGQAAPSEAIRTPFSACSPDDIYCLLYTSGTTGKPKGVMIPHRMVAWNGYSTVMNWGLREDDRSPIFTPLYHAGALGAFLMPIVAIGGTIVLHRKFDVGETWDTIARERCTVILGVPTIYKMMMDAPAFATVDVSSVRWMISGGAPLPTYIIEAYQKRGIVFRQGYGMTEVGVNCFSMTNDDSYRKVGAIGRPMMYTAARLTREDGSECGPGEVGELWFRGPHVSSGYWNNPEATAASYMPDGWFRTGDSARRDAEGFYTIAGRKKEMFISGGVNVYPAEIEAELVQHPSVSDAAVVGVGDPTWGEVGAAFVVAAPGATIDVAALEAWLAERLSRLKIPKRWNVLTELPRTPYGKVEKHRLVL
ncbi:MAG: AMP-binding protein [Acidobacteria bacterium]|nr:AMP-binding protein [Acidobacteriota bacterium]